MQTNPTLSRAQLRSLCQDTNSSPRSKLDAAAQLLEQFGATARNLRIIKRVAKQFEKHVAASPRTQQQIRWLAEKLKGRLERISEAEMLKSEDPDKNDDIDLPEDEPSAAQPKRVIGNVDLLPVDGDDDYWDELVHSATRREAFYRSWGFPATHSRAEMIADLAADPKRVESRTLRLQLWACTRERLDQKFEADGELVRAELTARGSEDNDAAREELAEQVAASGEPLVEFRKRDYDPEGTDLPALVRSKAGLLLDAISFTTTWPNIRLRHQPL